ncbi:hypothetical protein F5Y04DRAFT_28100 [Hypomontagnella monticulosa]|nr:hypothetical protein F5Y04DRAFT_28100 [Hypomontagnella monticulosa]
MQLKNLTFLTLGFLAGSSHADNDNCTLQGFSGNNCNGAAGLLKTLNDQGYCIAMGGRRSYLLNNCSSVRIEERPGDNCRGFRRFSVDYGNGCHGHDPNWRSLYAEIR